MSDGDDAFRGDPNTFESLITLAPDGSATRTEMRTVFPRKEQRDEAVGKYHAIEGGQQTLSHLATYFIETSETRPRAESSRSPASSISDVRLGDVATALGIVGLVGSRGFEQLRPGCATNLTARAVPTSMSWWYLGLTVAIAAMTALLQWWGLGFLWTSLVVIGVAWLLLLLLAWWPGLPPARRGPMVAAYLDHRFLLARAHLFTGRAERIVLDVPVEAVSIIPIGAPPAAIRFRIESDSGIEDWDLTMWSSASWPVRVQVPPAPAGP